MTAGVRTTGGSRLHEHWVPGATATTIGAAGKAAGGVVMLGKL
ncbi:MAG: hypothetical protein U5Q44_08160 [Dehalococcoidia bacterium]|nr:hypothetical protein [Dehalococcoidia bacterium]